tara:strand:+ start:2191 stop:2331 length:141 start_codon:yes stop_codon:yes gene_type:complete
MIKTLGRFVVGMIIGFFGVALFTDNAHIAMVVAVLCGVAVDQLLKR